MKLYVIRKKLKKNLDDFFKDDTASKLRAAELASYNYRLTEDHFHRLICKILGNPDRNSSTILYKNFNNGESFWIQTDADIDMQILNNSGYELIEERNLNDIYDGLSIGDICKLKMYVSPRKRNGKEKGNRRVFVYKWEDRIEWYEKKATKFGFEIGRNQLGEDYSIPLIEEKSINNIYFKHANDEKTKRTTYYKMIETEMIVKITDITAFKNLLLNGMSGGGKAYGVGLTLAKKIG